MKILIFTASTGGGHRRTSQALSEYFAEHFPDTNVRTVDALKEINKMVDKTVCGSYEFMAMKAPRMYGMLYNNTQKPKMDIVPAITAMCSRSMMPSIRDFEPDVIVTTHPFAGQMVSHLKLKGKITQPILSIMTDYAPHRAYLAPCIDAYVVPSPECKEALAKLDVPEERIFPYGIPISQTFFRHRDQAELREGFSLDGSLPVILVMAGSFGVNNIMDIFHVLDSSSAAFQLLIITGKNRKLFETFQKLEGNTNKSFHLVYFTNEVQKYMQASDLLITKPGGLTISEALACNLPMVVFDSIPGQEEDNAAFLVDRGMAIRMRKGDSPAALVESLLRDPQKLANMKEACRQFDTSDCCSNIAALMERLLTMPPVPVRRKRSRKFRLARMSRKFNVAVRKTIRRKKSTSR